MRAYAVALLALASITEASDHDWERLGERDGIIIEHRRAEDSALRELRLTARSSVEPAAFVAVLWRHDESPRFLPYLEKLDVLCDEGDAKLIYEQIRVPVFKDRDLTVRVTRTFSPDTGTYEVVSSAVPDEGPLESPDYVRVRHRGRWITINAVEESGPVPRSAGLAADG